MKNTLRFFILCSLFIQITAAGDDFIVTVPDFRDWWVFVDNLGTGSHIKSEYQFITSKGDIEVTMSKAAPPDWNEHKPPNDYPYVGIGTYFERSGNPVDLTGVEAIQLNYKLEGPVSLVLSQAGIQLGDEYIADLPPAEAYAELTIKWSDFYQPHWVSKNSTLDISKLRGISFEIRTRYESRAIVGIRSITFITNVR